MRLNKHDTRDALRLLWLALLVFSSPAVHAEGGMQGRAKAGAMASRCVAEEPEAGGAPTRKARRHYKVLFQVSDADPRKWRMALANIRNVQHELGRKNVDIELVVYGPGIDMLKFDSEAANEVIDAIDAGVKVVACGNTMKGMGLSSDDLVAKVRYVKAGVVEIIERQAQGYQYVRP